VINNDISIRKLWKLPLLVQNCLAFWASGHINIKLYRGCDGSGLPVPPRSSIIVALTIIMMQNANSQGSSPHFSIEMTNCFKDHRLIVQRDGLLMVALVIVPAPADPCGVSQFRTHLIYAEPQEQTADWRVLNDEFGGRGEYSTARSFTLSCVLRCSSPSTRRRPSTASRHNGSAVSYSSRSMCRIPASETC
jgi:hypothetical protein